MNIDPIPNEPPVDEELAHHVHDSIEDFRMLREILRTTNDPDKADEIGWPYGDPNYFGGDYAQLAEAQGDTLFALLGVDLKTAVGYGDMFSPEDEEHPRYVMGARGEITEEDMGVALYGDYATLYVYTQTLKHLAAGLGFYHRPEHFEDPHIIVCIPYGYLESFEFHAFLRQILRAWKEINGDSNPDHSPEHRAGDPDLEAREPATP